MFADFADLTAHKRYKILIATFVQRPIARLTTIFADGLINATTFSYFNIRAEGLALAVLWVKAGRGINELKDTYDSIKAKIALVTKLIDRAVVEPMVACAAALFSDADALAFAGLATLPSRNVGKPGIAEAPVCLECAHYEVRQFPAQRHQRLAEVPAVSTQNTIPYRETFHVSLGRHRPVGCRMGSRCADLGDVFDIAAPLAPIEAR